MTAPVDLNFALPGLLPVPAPLSPGGGAMCKGCVYLDAALFGACRLRIKRDAPDRASLPCRAEHRPDGREVIFIKEEP